MTHKNINNICDNNLLSGLIDFYGNFSKIDETKQLFNTLNDATDLEKRLQTKQISMEIWSYSISICYDYKTTTE